VRREQRLTAATVGLLALAAPVAVAAIAFVCVASPSLLSRISFNFGTLNMLATGLTSIRFAAAALLAIPVMRAH
jgi:hypothetical protein